VRKLIITHSTCQIGVAVLVIEVMPDLKLMPFGTKAFQYYSHRGFSPVVGGARKIRNRLNGFQSSHHRCSPG
jgi:hypothetical protein